MYRITALDLQERLILMLGGKADEDSVTDIRTAIRQAMRLVSAEASWRYYSDFLYLTTNAAFTEGSVVYTASTRTVVLTGDVWPSWAEQGVVQIGTIHMRVESVTNTTTLIVRAEDASVDDLSGDYTLYRYQYSLDNDLNIYKFGKMQIEQSNWVEYIPPQLFETDVRRPGLTSGARPRNFTLSRDDQNVGCTVLSLWGYPQTAMRLRMFYIRHPKDIMHWDYSVGTINTTASSTTVTGIDTAFTQDMVGCIMRSGNNRIDQPTSRDGRFPYVDELIIKEVTDATTLVLKAAATATRTDVAYSISSPIDCDYTTMIEAVAMCARNQLAKIRRVDPKLQAQYAIDWQEALYSAKAQDNPSTSVRVAGSWYGNNRGWNIWDAYYVLS